MKLIKALTLSLGEMGKPVVTQYQLGLLIHHLYRNKRYKSEAIPSLVKECAERHEFNHCLNQLLLQGILAHYKGMPNSVYSLLGIDHYPAEEVACTVDPFCYISHLSAMAHHGLTNRQPSRLFLSSPDASDWKSYAYKVMQKDLGDDLESYINNGLPTLSRAEFTKIGRMEVNRFTSKHLGAYKNISGKSLRVSTVGRTFLDCLRSPQLCGGLNHVLEVFEEHANTYLRLITDEVDLHGAPIDKVRAGYILQERLGIENEVIEGWVQFAQRGGSRKLDATAEYAHKWSDKWCLSLNIYERAA